MAACCLAEVFLMEFSKVIENFSCPDLSWLFIISFSACRMKRFASISVLILESFKEF